MQLQQSLADFAANIAQMRHVAVVSGRQLDEASNPATRFDLKTELLTGLPYTLVHADQVSAGLARLFVPFAPKKGLITDLDNTLWKGIVGEIGADQVAWDLNSHSQIHGLYQRTLRALAEQGVLLAIASKTIWKARNRRWRGRTFLFRGTKCFPRKFTGALSLGRWSAS